MTRYRSTSLQFDTSVCFLCGGIPTDWHHVFNGAMKKKSEQYGMMLHLCRQCHMRIHENPKEMKRLKAYAQEIYEQRYGTREDFLEDFKKSYL